MAAIASGKCGLLPDYFESLQQKESKERYLEKLKSIEGQGPYKFRVKSGLTILLLCSFVETLKIKSSISNYLFTSP